MDLPILGSAAPRYLWEGSSSGVMSYGVLAELWEAVPPPVAVVLPESAAVGADELQADSPSRHSETTAARSDALKRR